MLLTVTASIHSTSPIFSIVVEDILYIVYEYEDLQVVIEEGRCI